MFIIPCFPFGSVARPDPPGVHLTWPELFCAYFTFGTLNEAFEVILLKQLEALPEPKGFKKRLCDGSSGCTSESSVINVGSLLRRKIARGYRVLLSLDRFCASGPYLLVARVVYA